MSEHEEAVKALRELAPLHKKSPDQLSRAASKGLYPKLLAACVALGFAETGSGRIRAATRNCEHLCNKKNGSVVGVAWVPPRCLLGFHQSSE